MGYGMKVTLSAIICISVVTIQVSRSQEMMELKTVFFKITAEDKDDVSYLFGTHHAFGKNFFDSLIYVNECLKSCDLMIKENLSIPGAEASDIINRRTISTDWNKYLDKKDLAFLKNMFASSPTDFTKMTPAEMYAFLNRHYKKQFCLSDDSADTSLSLDDYIGVKAQQENLKLIGLETTEKQIELINQDVQGMPKKVHKRRLANIISLIKSGNSSHCEETKWYRQMDIDYLLDRPCPNTLVLTNRNNEWMETIAKSIKSNRCFIAVGLSHLMYDCGLLSQLQELGYTITPMKVI